MSPIQLEAPTIRRFTRARKLLKKAAKDNTTPQSDMMMREIAYVLHLTECVRKELKKEGKV